MNKYFSLVLIFISTTALANSFDQFIGKYDVISEVKIEKLNASFCKRFKLTDMISFEVQESINEKLDQSHGLYFHNASGWSFHPVMDYYLEGEFDSSIGTYAKTTGSANSAKNEYGTFGTPQNRKLTIEIEIMENEYLLKVAEENFEKSEITSACYYEVKLK